MIAAAIAQEEMFKIHTITLYSTDIILIPARECTGAIVRIASYTVCFLGFPQFCFVTLKKNYGVVKL